MPNDKDAIIVTDAEQIDPVEAEKLIAGKNEPLTNCIPESDVVW